MPYAEKNTYIGIKTNKYLKSPIPFPNANKLVNDNTAKNIKIIILFTEIFFFIITMDNITKKTKLGNKIQPEYIEYFKIEFLRNSVLSPDIVPISLVPSLFSITIFCSENSVACISVSKIEILSMSLTNKKLDSNTINENEIMPIPILVIV